MKFSVLAALTVAVSPATAEIYFKEDFNDDGWKDRWTESTKWKSAAEMGTWKHTAGDWHADPDDKGIQTGEDHRFYGISAKLDKPFFSADKELVLQYTVKNEQNMDCGGCYIKLLPGGDSFDAEKFGGDAPYAVMFGPDMCGANSRKTHLIYHYDKKDDNLLITNHLNLEMDLLSHVYTMVLRPDNTFEVFIDNESIRQDKLDKAFRFLEPEQIKDPDESKPDDWVDEVKIPDPEDVKPEGYDDIPEEIPDPDASKPDDWDEEDDGEWEPPMIDNPEYKGKWKPKMIDNPDYKGKWEHPMIDNPDYKYDPDMYKICKDGCTHVGFELWQVTSGTVFDDIIVTDSLEEAQAYAKETFFKKKDAEKEMYDKVQEEKREAAMADKDDMDDMDEDFDMDGMMDEF